MISETGSKHPRRRARLCARRVAGLTLVLAAGLSGGAHAANLCVNAAGTEKAWTGLGYDGSQCDAWYATINLAATAAAPVGDTLVLSMLDDTVHTLTADTPAGKSFTIRNAHNSRAYADCIVSAEGGSIRQDLSAGGVVQLRGVTIRDGASAAAVNVAGTAVADAALIIDSVQFADNVSLAPGRALPPALALATAPAGNAVTYTILDSVFSNNRHIGAGGGALSFVNGSSLTIQRSLFDGNVAEADTGGAIWINPTRVADGCQVNIVSSQFYSNIAETGGAMLASRDCSISLRDSVVGASGRGNYISAESEFIRGVMFVLTDDTPVSLEVRDSEFAYNTINPLLQTGDGGAVRVTNGATGKGFVTALFEDSVFHHNEAWSGPAIHAGGETVSVVRRCRFFDNVARGWAGAYFASGTRDSPPFGSHTIAHSLFVNNRTNNAGGAVRVAAYTTAHIYNSTFINNSAADDGNHIDARTSAIGERSTITNSVFWSDEENGLADISAESFASFGEIRHTAHRAGAIGDFGALVTDSVLLTRSPVTGDYQLRASSSCIDAGLDLTGVIPALDIVGRSLPSGPQWDLGAFEFWRQPIKRTHRK